MEALKRSAPVPIRIEPMGADMDGYFSASEQRIAILQDKLDAANKIISYQDANIQTLTQSNQYLLEQLRKND